MGVRLKIGPGVALRVVCRGFFLILTLSEAAVCHVGRRIAQKPDFFFAVRPKSSQFRRLRRSRGNLETVLAFTGVISAMSFLINSQINLGICLTL